MAMAQAKNISLSSRNLEEESSDTNTFRDSNIGIQDSQTISQAGDLEVLTVSLDNHKLTSSSRYQHINKTNNIGYLNHHLLLSSCIGLSLLFIIVSTLVLNLTDVETIGHTAQNILKLLQYSSLCSFSGGVSVVVTIKCVLRVKIPCFNSYLANRREILKHLVEEFLLSEVFEERFVKQYMKRADCVQDIENFQSSVMLLDSAKFKDLLVNKYQAIQNSPEGAILESLGIPSNDLQQYFQTFITEFLVDLHKITPNSSQDSSHFDVKLFRKFVENITVERMYHLDKDQLKPIISRTIDVHLDLIVIFVSILMGLFGLVFGSVVIFT